jgi:hypothetical protein
MERKRKGLTGSRHSGKVAQSEERLSGSPKWQQIFGGALVWGCLPRPNSWGSRIGANLISPIRSSCTSHPHG